MAIIRQRREKNYSIISNEILDDQRISFKARGLLAYMLSKSDDWKFYVDELANHSEKDGKKAVQSALKEIENAGYLKRIKQRDKQGHFSEQDWQLLDIPTFSPQPQKRQTAERQTAKRQTANGPLPRTDSTKNLNNQELNKERETHTENAFEAFSKTNAVLNGFTRPQLVEAVDRFGDDVVTFAINRMAEQATYPSFSFLNQKLNAYEDSDVKSVEDAKTFEQKRKETNDKKPQRSNNKTRHHSIKATWDKEHERKEKLKKEYLAKYGEVPVNLDTLMDRPNIKPLFQKDETITDADMPW